MLLAVISKERKTRDLTEQRKKNIKKGNLTKSTKQEHHLPTGKILYPNTQGRWF